MSVSLIIKCPRDYLCHLTNRQVVLEDRGTIIVTISHWNRGIGYKPNFMYIVL